ncbi:MAG: sulfatase-like hydrolase/transferase [Candidatus Brocadiia bacterium]
MPTTPTRIDFHPYREKDILIKKICCTRAAYYGLVEWFDDLIGDILGTLDEMDLAENTIVIYTSDHGDQVGEHGMWWKSTFYEGSAGVPFIIRWPGKLEPGARIKKQPCDPFGWPHAGDSRPNNYVDVVD